MHKDYKQFLAGHMDDLTDTEKRLLRTAGKHIAKLNKEISDAKYIERLLSLAPVSDLQAARREARARLTVLVEQIVARVSKAEELRAKRNGHPDEDAGQSDNVLGKIPVEKVKVHREGSFIVNRRSAVDLFNKLHEALQNKDWLDDPDRKMIVDFKSDMPGNW